MCRGNMKVSNTGINIIKQFEGFKKEAYRCSANKLTIGYGHVIREHEKELINKSITKEEGDKLLKEDIKRFENYLNDIIKKHKIHLNQNQFDVLISFCYNVGPFTDAMIYRLLNNNLNEVGEALLLYNKVGGKIIPGLTKRRQKERELFFS